MTFRCLRKGILGPGPLWRQVYPVPRQGKLQQIGLEQKSMMTKDPPRLLWTPEMVSRFWDYESNFPERYFTFQHGTEMARQLHRHLRGRQTVLDYGCGLGYLLGEFLTSGMQGAGLDFSPEAMRKANERLSGHPNFLGTFDLKRLRASGLRFDCITVVEVIEHLYDEQLEPILDELGQFLTPDGVVIFSTPNEEDLARSSLLCPVTGEVFHRRQHVRNWSKESLSHYLEQRGYLIVNCFAANFRGGPSQANKKSGLSAQWAVLKNSFARNILMKKKKLPHLVAIARPGHPKATWQS